MQQRERGRNPLGPHSPAHCAAGGGARPNFTRARFSSARSSCWPGRTEANRLRVEGGGVREMEGEMEGGGTMTTCLGSSAKKKKKKTLANSCVFSTAGVQRVLDPDDEP